MALQPVFHRKRSACVSGSGLVTVVCCVCGLRQQKYPRLLWTSGCLCRIFHTSSPRRCTELRSDLSGAPERRGRVEGFPPRLPAGVFAPPTEAPGTAEDRPEAGPLSPRVLQCTPRVLTGDTGSVLRLGSVTSSGGSEGRCGIGAVASGGLRTPVPPRLRSSRVDLQTRPWRSISVRQCCRIPGQLCSPSQQQTGRRLHTDRKQHQQTDSSAANNLLSALSHQQIISGIRLFDLIQ